MRTRVHLAVRRARLSAAALIAVSAFVVGCSQLSTTQVWPWSTAKVEKVQPGQMTVVWTHATESDAGHTMRGFRGRIFFYPKHKSATAGKEPDRDADNSIKVDGTLTVYAFDVTADGKPSAVTPRKFIFGSEQLKKMCSASEEKPSYQVWLPWDAVGGPLKKVNLWTRFDGINPVSVVMSDNMPQQLPGVAQVAAVDQAPSRVKAPANATPTTQSPRGPLAQAVYETSAKPAEASGAPTGPRTGGLSATPDGSSPAAAPTTSTAASTADWWK
jgi:hypothetical protein